MLAGRFVEDSRVTLCELWEAAGLLFFPAHVAIALDRACFVHANAHPMCVSVDSSSYGQRLRQALNGVRRVLPG